jgi:hypothetical protein
MENKLVELLKSRKFWAAFVGLLVVFVGDRGGLTPAQIQDAIIVLVTFIGGVAVENVAKSRG